MGDFVVYAKARLSQVDRPAGQNKKSEKTKHNKTLLTTNRLRLPQTEAVSCYNGCMKRIPLNGGRHTKVDDDIYAEVSGINWHVKRGYACHTYYVKETQKTGETLLLHRYIMRPSSSSEYVDHINGDKLDNQRSNLRISTHTQNLWNSKKYKGNNPYKGVQKVRSRRNPWVAVIRCNKVIHYLGVHPTAEEAAKAYNVKALELHGEFASLNEL